MRPLRPHPPLDGGVEAPVQPARPLPPGAALWRATAPRPAAVQPAPDPSGLAEEAPAPVWRSRRPPRRAAQAPTLVPTLAPATLADRTGRRPRVVSAQPLAPSVPPQGDAMPAPREGPEAGDPRAPWPPAPPPQPPEAQHWDADGWHAPGGWRDPEGWSVPPWEAPGPGTQGPADPSAEAGAAVPPARISLLTDLPEEGAGDLRAFVRPPAQPTVPAAGQADAGVSGPDGVAVEVPDAPAPRRRWRLRRSPAPEVAPRLQPRPRQTPRDPAPSRMAYRLHRLWLTPMVRLVVRVGLPAWVLAMGVGLIAADPDRRAWLGSQWDGLRDGIAARPEFQVTGLTVIGASAPVEAALRAMLPQEWPVSSFGLDLGALRAEIETLDAVARAELRVGADSRLAVEVTERRPAAVWRNGDGLVLLDGEGYRVARLLARAGRPDLPLLAGAGAERAVPEALALMAAAAPLRNDLIGLMRMGERRWDVVLTGDRRILLPETGALAALERVLAQDAAQELLSRDIVQVDMRLPQRPTVRMSEAAVDELRRVRTGAAPATGAGGAMR